MKLHSSKFKNQLTLSLSFFIIQAALVFLIRSQQLVKIPDLAHTAWSLFSISSNDLMLAFGFCCLMSFIPSLKKVLIPLNFTLALGLFLPVFFQIKMGIPLSLGLMGQVGGIFELKTSVADKSNFRNIIIFITIMCGLILSLFVLVQFRERLMRLKYLIGLISIAIFVPALISNLTQSSIQKKYSYTFMLRLFGEMELNSKLKESKLLVGIVSKPKPTEQINALGDTKKNIILVVLETFDYSIVRDKAMFEKVMPNLFRRSLNSSQFPNHYSPWPFSSKSLYSIMCGAYPYPGKLIDLRVKPDDNCQGWATELQKAGFQLWVGYSGDLAYDRMGQFFSHQANFKEEERKSLSRFKLEEWGLGIDDQALILGFKEFLDKRDKQKSFGATFIPIGSHHPYWTPKGTKVNFKDAFQSSFNYQDQVLENLFKLIEKENLNNDTVIIVTGDHGRREGSNLENQVINENIYHVPLFVFNSPLFPVGIAEHGTSHLDLKGTILRVTNVGGSMLADQELSRKKDFMVMYDLEHTSYLLKSKDGQSTLFNLDSDAVYRGDQWVNDHSRPCLDCRQELATLRGFIDMAKEKYETP